MAEALASLMTITLLPGSPRLRSCEHDHLIGWYNGGAPQRKDAPSGASERPGGRSDRSNPPWPTALPPGCIAPCSDAPGVVWKFLLAVRGVDEQGTEVGQVAQLADSGVERKRLYLDQAGSVRGGRRYRRLVLPTGADRVREIVGAPRAGNR